MDITLNSFGDSMTELSRIAADYYGDMEYDPATGRIYHGNSGLSSCEINVRRVEGNTLITAGGTSSYGTAQNGGGTCVLSAGGKVSLLRTASGRGDDGHQQSQLLFRRRSTLPRPTSPSGRTVTMMPRQALGWTVWGSPARSTACRRTGTACVPLMRKPVSCTCTPSANRRRTGCSLCKSMARRASALPVRPIRSGCPV